MLITNLRLQSIISKNKDTVEEKSVSFMIFILESIPVCFCISPLAVALKEGTGGADTHGLGA